MFSKERLRRCNTVIEVATEVASPSEIPLLGFDKQTVSSTIDAGIASGE